MFVIAVAYAIAFVVWKSRFPWLVAGIAGGLIHVLIQIPFMLRYGTQWQSIAVLFFELFVACCAGGFVASLIPTDRPGKQKPQSNYY